MVEIEDYREPTVNDLRNRIVNRWGVIGGLGSAAICFGATFLGVESLADIIKSPELTSPVMHFSISTVTGIFGGMMGGAFGLEPLGKWRADLALPLPRRSYPLQPTQETIYGIDTVDR